MNGGTLYTIFLVILGIIFTIGMYDYRGLVKIQDSRMKLFNEILGPAIAEGKEIDPMEVKKILAEIKNNQPILPFLGVSDDALNRFVCERIELTVEEVRAKGDRITADDLGEIGSFFECKI